MIKPYKVNISKKFINQISKKVDQYPWPDINKNEGWNMGTNYDYLKNLSKYWVNGFNWNDYQKKINKFSNYLIKVDSVNIHFIKEKGSGKNPKPLLLMHGWPGSVIEFLDIIERLAHPEKFGGNVEDAFDLIIPSLPGFAFSGQLKKPLGPRKMAHIINKLMTKKLNYRKYYAQGGDWGATIANWLGYDHAKSCKAIHINCLTMRHPDGPQTREEKKWQNKFNRDQLMQDGYRTQQSTKPQTLSYAMIDSPVGIAAWILEKMYFWSDIKGKTLESVYSKDKLIANIMTYIVTKTFNSAAWIYYGRREEGGRYFPKKFKKISIPTGIAVYPAEMSEWPPKSYVNRIFNVCYWSKKKKGGHFAALEQPEIFIKDICNFFNVVLKKDNKKNFK